MSDLDALTRRALQFRAERDWQQFHNPKDQFLSLVLEATELMELSQWRNGDTLDQHLKDHHQDLADELCDVLHWVLLIAHDHNVNLPAAFEAKMQRNELKYPLDKSRGQHTKYKDL